MGKFEKPSIDKRIAAKMFDEAKLNRMRNREIEKVGKKRNLMGLKRASLPVIETDFLRKCDSKCKRCNKEKGSYGVTFEWHLEPIDVLDDYKGFYGFSKYGSTKRMFSKITNGIIVEPAKIKIMKYLQEHKSEVPMIYVLKSRDHKLDEKLLNFILDTFDLPTAVSTTEMDEISIQNHLNAHKSLIVFIDDEENQLRNILKSIEYGKVKDIYMMPVSIGCENQHSGVFNPPLLNILPKFLYQNYGEIKVNFNEPYTCEELLQWIRDYETTEETMYDAIESHLVHDIAFKRPVFPTNILAYVLLTYFRFTGGTIEEIAARIDEIRTSNYSIDFAFDGESLDVAKYAVMKLNKKLIINENLMIKPIEKSALLIELQDYAETLICHFALQSMLILSAEHYKRTNGYVDYNRMIQLAVDYCEILQLEIPLLKPCSSLRDQLDHAFDILSRKDLLTRPTITYTENEKRAQRIAQYFDDFDEYDDDSYEDYENDEDNLSPENEVIINVSMQKEIDFLKNVTLPIQESYMNVVYTLKRLIGKQIINQIYFLDLALSTMLDECLCGNCKYWESCSVKWLKNSMKLLELWGVIKKITYSDHHYLINEKYDNEEAIHRIARHIEQFSDY